MTELSFERLDAYSGQALKQIAKDLAGKVNDRNTARMLKERNLRGVIGRHYNAQVSYENLQKTSEKMNTDRSNDVLQVAQFAAYVICDEHGITRGMATVMPGLGLFKQRVWMPAGIARRLPGVSSPVGSQASGPNVAGWIDAQVGGSEPLRNLYEGILERTDGMGWTVEPNGERSIHRINAIKAAGMCAIGTTARYDNFELPMWSPPTSQLLVASGIGS